MFRITEDPSSGSLVECLDENYKNDFTIFVVLAKNCTRLPDDGSSVIRNMLEYF